MQEDSSMTPKWLHRMIMAPKMKKLVRAYLNWRRKNPGQGRKGVQQVVKLMGLSPQDGNQLVDTLNDLVKQGKLPKHLALEKELKVQKRARELGVGKHDSYYLSKLDPETRKKYEPQKRPAPMQVSKPQGQTFNWLKRR